MTKTLSQIRADARADFVAICERYGIGQDGSNTVKNLQAGIDSLIDATFLTIKEGIVPEEETDLERYESSHTVRTFKIGYNRCRTEVLRNFDAMEGNEKSV